ncbi:hypothetical protein OSTOST_21536, partial [Ostertagia ostertagi]
MVASLPGNVLGNTTVRDSFHIILTPFTYCLLIFIIYGILSLLVTLKIVHGIINPKFKSFFQKASTNLGTDHRLVDHPPIGPISYCNIRITILSVIHHSIFCNIPVDHESHNYLFTIKGQQDKQSNSDGGRVTIQKVSEWSKVIRKFLPIFFLTIYFLPILTTWFLYPATTYLRIGPQIPAFGYGAGFDYKKVYPN